MHCTAPRTFNLRPIVLQSKTGSTNNFPIVTDTDVVQSRNSVTNQAALTEPRMTVGDTHFLPNVRMADKNRK